MDDFKLEDVRMHDGSRQFATLPESCTWNSLRDHMASLQGVKVKAFLSDGVTEMWLDFDFAGHCFTVNNQYAEFWFFVKDPRCDNTILQQVTRHASELLDR